MAALVEAITGRQVVNGGRYVDLPPHRLPDFTINLTEAVIAMRYTTITDTHNCGHVHTVVVASRLSVVPGSRKIGGQKMWIDNILGWTGLSMEESLPSTEDSVFWRGIVRRSAKLRPLASRSAEARPRDD